MRNWKHTNRSSKNWSAIQTQELKRSELKYSNVFHHSPSFIIVSNADRGMILEINDSFTKKIGYTAEELTGKQLTDFNIS